MATTKDKKSSKQDKQMDVTTTGSSDSDNISSSSTSGNSTVAIDRSSIPAVPLHETFSGSSDDTLHHLAELGVTSYNLEQVEHNVIQQTLQKQQQLQQQKKEQQQKKLEGIELKIHELEQEINSLKHQINKATTASASKLPYSKQVEEQEIVDTLKLKLTVKVSNIPSSSNMAI